jgi:hypothetical protein
MVIDYADAWDFLDDDGRPFKLQFRRNVARRHDPRIFDGTGQLIAVVADSQRPDNHDEIALSRPGVLQADVEHAIDGWEDWATVVDDGIYRWLSLARVRSRIHAAGLD